MRGTLIGIWGDLLDSLWEPLSLHESAPPDFYSELYREMCAALINPPHPEVLAEVVSDRALARKAVVAASDTELAGEWEVVRFMEGFFDTCEELAGDDLSNAYFTSVEALINRFSLRYDLRRPFVLCPTLSGVFTSLTASLRAFAEQDAHLLAILNDFEDSFRDVRIDESEGRLRTAIQKQFNLLEALGTANPQVSAGTLGAMCNEVGTWPHEAVKEAAKQLYKFACNYPGIRHGGTPASAIRPIDMRELAVLLSLMGIVPYMNPSISSAGFYRRVR